MKHLRFALPAVAVGVASASTAAYPAAADPAQYVNAFIGTLNGGHVFAGATLPWGSVKAGADSLSGDNQAGYVSDGTPITGISQLHDDGTGGGASLGNFPFLPYNTSQCADNNLQNCVIDHTNRAVPHGTPSASPGYFGIPLNNGVNAEVTVTQHAALHRFTYPSGTKEPILLLEVTRDLSGSYRAPGNYTVSPATHGGVRVTGGGTFGPSFGEGQYAVYFCMDTTATLAQAQSFSTVSGSVEYTTVNPKQTFSATIGSNSPAGLLFGFNSVPAETLNVRMGISWTSTAKACAYAEEEIPNLGGFNTVKSDARARWNEVLNTVQVDDTGVSEDTQTLFWSSLYRAYISPTNITGDNPLWVSTEPYYDSYYCIWDSFRVVHPLYAITAPTTQAEVVRALIDVYRNTGWLPDCRMSLDMGYTQGGSNADSLLSDSYTKGITAGINWEDGYAAMVQDATNEGDFSVQGRGGIASRAKLGYVPFNDTSDNPPNEGPNTRSASRTLEYAYNDFGIGLVAKGLGKTADAQHYFNKSGDWFNLWNANASNSGYSGFIQPRWSNGSWYYDPRYDLNDVFRPDHCSPVFGHDDCFLNPTGGEFYEASSWEYSWYVPQDQASLVKAVGGPATYSARLDAFFADGFHDIGDEPGFLPTYLYNYVGQPAKTVDRVDAILNQYFNTRQASFLPFRAASLLMLGRSLNGLPGNDDSGAMGAYTVWSHLGFYPVAGQATYLLNRPYFPKITIRNEATGKTATIIAHGLSATNIYVQSATLNGKPYTKNWISHDIFTSGSTLELQMGSSKNSTWGTAEADLPPSLSTGGFD
ncbi:Alpha-1-2-mannosidase family protein [Mycena chlorophos]|uniref:Alpha-1-2-mannosidase family protein n=1 Tax=Mycena chlorophos TaxID=658473 RepID=A0A8H6WDA1_MYCCL|nr:Alpha-1-2-mannosidase family protein [Mycena chlorophos]